jgi:hypothetical protein
MRMKLNSWVPAATVIIFVAAGRRSAAEFTNSFDDITRGSSVRLTWDGVQPQQYPLCIAAQVIDKDGEDGFSADAYRVNITSTFLVPAPVHRGVWGEHPFFLSLLQGLVAFSVLISDCPARLRDYPEEERDS